MNRRRFLWLLVAALVVLSGGLYLSTPRGVPRESRDQPLLPTLAQELNTVTSLNIRKGSAAPSVSLHKTADQWSVAERADYPADAAKVRHLLLALGDAKIVEEKTSNPASFAIIGVEDPAQPGATGAEIAVTAQDGKHVVIVGKSVGEGNFARRSGENKSYVVEPAISFETDPRFWIDSRLIDVPSASIQTVEVKPPTGAGYVIHRLKPNEENYSLEGTPAGRKAADAPALAPPVTMLSGLNAEDVTGADGIDFSKPAQATVTLADGNVITLMGAPVADKHWIQVKSSKDAVLTAKAQGRAFEVAGYRYDAIFRPLEQLLVPKVPPAPAKTAAPGQKPVHGAKPAPPPNPAAAPAP
jgi:hypothetical protein